MGKWDLDSVDPEMGIYEREIRERRHIVDSSDIDVFASSINPRWGYKHKLVSYWEARKTVAQSAESIFVDSGYRRYGNIDEIIEACVDLEADYCTGPDVTPHFDIYDQVPMTSRAKEAWYYGRKLEQSDAEAEFLIPLHRPIEEHLDELANFQPGDSDRTVNLLERFPGVAVGLKKAPVSERIEILAMIERMTPPGTHVHALSPGTEIEMIGFLRENPNMVDSLDVSTPESAPANNKIPDLEWFQHVVPFPTGTDVSTLRASRSTEIALMLNYMLSDLCDDNVFQDIREAVYGYEDTDVLEHQITWDTFNNEVLSHD